MAMEGLESLLVWWEVSWVQILPMLFTSYHLRQIFSLLNVFFLLERSKWNLKKKKKNTSSTDYRVLVLTPVSSIKICFSFLLVIVRLPSFYGCRHFSIADTCFQSVERADAGP